jgi:MFS superfamily sulfate permease-like transporter
MGKVPSEKAAWGSITNHPERKTIDGILVIRLDAPLFWANATEVQDEILGVVDADPEIRALLLDMEATSQLDTTAIDMMEQLLVQLRARNVELFLVRVFFRARRVLDRAAFIDELGPDRMWHSISAGVRAARALVNVTAKAHAQDLSEDEFAYADSDERIAVDTDQAGPPEESEPPRPKAPKGGYQDPERSQRG